MELIKTKRLILRPLRMDDANAMYQYAKKPFIGPLAGWAPHESIEETLQVIKVMVKEKNTYAITLLDTKEMIGTISLHIEDFIQALEGIREIGFTISDGYWNQGYATEATEALMAYAFNNHINKLVIGHYFENIASKKVIQKCGFQFSHIEKRLDYQQKLKDVWVYERFNTK